MTTTPTVKRYDFGMTVNLGEPGMEEYEGGDYILYSDHLEAIARVRREAIYEAMNAVEAERHRHAMRANVTWGEAENSALDMAAGCSTCIIAIRALLTQPAQEGGKP